MRGFPYRSHRCWCGLLATTNFEGEEFCAWHFPFKEACIKPLTRLAEIVGDERKNQYIDEWFPMDDDFSWHKLLENVEWLLPRLDIATGLLLLTH
jgi:hypothetical protein